jgi:hypothetical protein
MVAGSMMCHCNVYTQIDANSLITNNNSDSVISYFVLYYLYSDRRELVIY